MTTPKEFDIRGTFSISLIVSLIVASFVVGGIVSRLLSQEDDIKASKDYTTQEVGGLRSDWERKNDEYERRLQNLEKHHVKE